MFVTTPKLPPAPTTTTATEVTPAGTTKLPDAVKTCSPTGPPAHAPATQTDPAAHARPQPPQFVALDVSAASHPFAALPSQSPNPAVHAYPHAPAAQVVAVFARESQARPHAPQFATLARSPTSHPSAPTWLQSP